MLSYSYEQPFTWSVSFNISKTTSENQGVLVPSSEVLLDALQLSSSKSHCENDLFI